MADQTPADVRGIAMTDARTVTVDRVSKAYHRRVHRPSLAHEVMSGFTGSRETVSLRWVLRDVSFTLAPGESLGVIGRNGAGKTTLLKILAGIAHPTSGSVRVPLRVSAQFAVGAGFNQALTGVENAHLQGTMLGMTNREVRELLPAIEAFAELGEAMQRPMWTYSTGMVTRLAFAIAAHARRDLMLLDEALTGGDVAFQERCRGVLAEARAARCSMIVVSHNPDSILELCDRALWLDYGAVRRLGPAESVLSEYLRST